MDGEKALLLSVLDHQRRHVLGTVDGLSDDDLRRPVLPSGWSCAGMIQHLTIEVERFWIRGVVAGAAIDLGGSDRDPAAAWQVARDVPAVAVLAAYRRETALADELIAATDLDAGPAWWPEDFPGGRHRHLRQTLLHVITETAAHTGHLDAARELIDGRQWLVLTD
ncbi:MAG: DinB family protein [Actinomycetales bacterium]